MNEPTVAGPNGTEIGARSGAVRPAGATAAAEPSVAAGSSAAGPSSASASAQPAASSAPAQASDTSFPEEHINQLMSMFGVARREAIQALEISGGNLDTAAGMFME
jgi:DNA damage-inducible protein 1